jgi:hypothetical protein
MGQVITVDECPNCGAELKGAYCSECGQKAGHSNPSAHELLHEVWHEVLHLDGKLFATTRALLFRPGFLTREHFAGRRARYVPPLRLYLIFSVLYFGVVQLLPADAGRRSQFNLTVTPSAGETAADVQRELESKGFKNQEDARRQTNEALVHYIPQAFFILVPFFAALVGLVNWRSGLNYPQHLYFALHVHSAAFAISAISQVAWVIPNASIGDLVRAVGVFSMFGYAGAAMKRVYGTTIVGTIWRTMVIVLIYGMAIGVTAVAIGLGWLLLHSSGAAAH